MIKKDFAISEILKLSFQFVSTDFTARIKDGFPIVILITVAFNGLNFLMSNSLASNFTIILFVLFSMLLTSCIGISVHKEIITNFRQAFLSHFLSLINLKYFFNITLISLIAISPLLIHFFFKFFNKINFFGFNISYLFFLWILSCVFALKLIFILPKVALNKNFSYSIQELNNFGFKLFLIFIIITIIFFIPSVFVLSFQVSILNSNSQFYLVIKPMFDFISFYISYLNYLVIFAAISYVYKKAN